ncbi:MAG TPA: putative glycoside hydrolase [Longimicrobiales bacterium]
MSDYRDMQSDARADDGVSPVGRNRQRKIRLAVAGALAVVLSAGAFATVSLRPGDPTAAAPDIVQGGVVPAPPAADSAGTASAAEARAAADTTTADTMGTATAVIPDGTIRNPDGAAPGRPGERVIPVATPEVVRGLYLNAWAAGSTRKLDRLIGIANETEVNTFVIDVKEGGEVSYRSTVPLVNEVGSARTHISDMRAVLRKLKENGIYPIARIVCFRDEVLANAKPQWAIQKEDGSVWRDRDDHAWVDSFNREVWDYNIAIAREAIEMGFAEIQWDYVRFPDVPPSLMKTAVFPARNGRTKADAIREFLLYSREQLASYDVPVTADVFGLTVSVKNDLGIGQQWEKMSDATDVLLPMVYPSHFAKGSYGIASPNANPYDIVNKAMEYAVKRNAGIEGGAKIRPWLQDFTLGAPKYGAEQVRAQMQGAYDAGVKEWVLWNPGSNYTASALEPSGSVVQ